MTWIRTIPFEDAEGKVKDLYERIKGPNNNVDNIMMAHSLRPHSMEGHMALYKNVLHHSRNTLPKWLLEAIGVCVSIIIITGCPSRIAIGIIVAKRAVVYPITISQCHA